MIINLIKSFIFLINNSSLFIIIYYKHIYELKNNQIKMGLLELELDINKNISKKYILKMLNSHLMYILMLYTMNVNKNL